MNGLANALKSMNNTVYHSNLTIQRINYAHNLLLTLADIDHRLNQLHKGVRKLESGMSMIYSYINTISIETVTPKLINS